MSGILDESSASTGSRSSMGDTRSIVLALQALQEKIRKLEIDRNYHQEQCDKARANHEEYKRDVEAQLDRERAEHRRRETELQDLISRATAERTTLQSTLEESRRDIGQFRTELETLLDRERRDASKRDEKLQAELNELHAELAKERRTAEQSVKLIESLRAEKDTIETTNRRLEDTVQDLIAMNNNLMAGGGKKKAPASAAAAPAPATARRPSGGAPATRVSALKPSSHNASTVSARGARPASAHARRPSPSGAPHYANPTFNSSQRCERHAHHEQSFEERRSGSAHGFRSATPPPPPAQAHVAPARRAEERKIDERLEALDELYGELEAEHQALNQRYADVVRKANNPDGAAVVSPGQLTAELNSIMTQIDRKTEQMQMVRQSREKLERGGGDRPSNVARGQRGTVPKGFDKATKKTALMNELRSLFTRSSMQ